MVNRFEIDLTVAKCRHGDKTHIHTEHLIKIDPILWKLKPVSRKRDKRWSSD